MSNKRTPDQKRSSRSRWLRTLAQSFVAVVLAAVFGWVGATLEDESTVRELGTYGPLVLPVLTAAVAGLQNAAEDRGWVRDRRGS